MMPRYKVQPHFVPAGDWVDAESPEEAVEQATEEWAEMIRRPGNAIVITEAEYQAEVRRLKDAKKETQ